MSTNWTIQSRTKQRHSDAVDFPSNTFTPVHLSLSHLNIYSSCSTHPCWKPPPTTQHPTVSGAVTPYTVIVSVTSPSLWVGLFSNIEQDSLHVYLYKCRLNCWVFSAFSILVADLQIFFDFYPLTCSFEQDISSFNLLISLITVFSAPLCDLGPKSV